MLNRVIRFLLLLVSFPAGFMHKLCPIPSVFCILRLASDLVTFVNTVRYSALVFVVDPDYLSDSLPLIAVYKSSFLLIPAVAYVDEVSLKRRYRWRSRATEKLEAHSTEWLPI